MPRRRWGTGTISHRRSEGRWVAALSLGRDERGRRVRKVLYGRTRAEAAARLEEARRRLGRVTTLDGTRLTVGQYLAQWLAAVQPTVRPSTWTSYRGHVENQLAPLHGLPLWRLTPGAIRQLLAERLAQGYAPRTVQYVLVVLRAALAQAVRDGLLDRNVAAAVDPPPVRRVAPPLVDAARARRILAAFRGHRLEALVTVALATGLRRGELLALTWGDIDEAAGLLRVRESKTAAGVRSVPLPLLAARALGTIERRAVGIFVSRSGRPLDGAAVTRGFQRQLARAGLPRLRFHDLRHAAATLYLAEGVPESVIRDLLGHSSIRVTEAYAHVLPEAQREAARRLQRALIGPLKGGEKR